MSDDCGFWQPWWPRVAISRKERSDWLVELLKKMEDDPDITGLQRAGGDSIVRVVRNKEQGTIELYDLELRRTGIIYERPRKEAADHA